MLGSTIIDMAEQGMYTIAHQHRSTGPMMPRALPGPPCSGAARAGVGAALVATLDGVDTANAWSPLSVCVALPA